MTPSLNIPFEWTSRSNNQRSMCRLRRYDGTPVGTLILLSEVWTNPGPSVTNAAEELLRAVCTAFELDPETTFFVEHYDACSYKGGRETPDFSRVRLDEKGHPVWSPLPEAMIRQLIGGEVFSEHEARLASLAEQRSPQTL